MTEHSQRMVTARVGFPHDVVVVDLVRELTLTADGSKVLGRKPRNIRLASTAMKVPMYLNAERAYEIGQALIDASALMEEEAGHANRV